MIALLFILATKPEALPTWALGEFKRPIGVNPVILPNERSSFLDPMSKHRVQWEASDTFNPAATVKKGHLVVLYRAEDHLQEGIGRRTSRLGYAESRDGIHFVRRGEPVLFPAEDNQKEAEWPGGCEDPRVVMTAEGTYAVFYTQWNRNRAQLAVATSPDLIHWTKFGSIFRNSTFHPDFFKSASPVTTVKNGRQVLAKIDGKYWMYWGEDAVHAATSTNLTDWSPVMDASGNVEKLAEPRKGFFDSDLTECGPPSVETKDGIVLLYNGKNDSGNGGDPHFGAGAYCAGQMLFDKENPTKLLARLNTPFFHPTEPYEKSGQYVQGTVFVEGLTWFKEKWFLLYGCADSKVGVAIYNPKPQTSRTLAP